MREHTTQRYIGKVACCASVSPYYSVVCNTCSSYGYHHKESKKITLHESILDKKVDMQEHTTQRYFGKVACLSS